jgi:uncharacterized membrane protein YgcG
MKKLITAIAIGAFTFAGTAVNADARPPSGHGYHTPSSTVYVSGYRYGRPVYTQKYFIGYDHCGNPKFAYRTVSAPNRGYSQHHSTRHSGYSNSRGHGSYGNGSSSRYYGNRRSSGASVNFSFRR